MGDPSSKSKYSSVIDSEKYREGKGEKEFEKQQWKESETEIST